MEKVEKNKKLNTILLAILGVIIVAIIVALIMLHNVNQKNKAAFNAALNDYCIAQGLKISQEKDEFTVNISWKKWEELANGLQTLYCELVYGEITTLLWDHHIYKKPQYPFVKFMVDGERVATGVGGDVEKLQQ